MQRFTIFSIISLLISFSAGALVRRIDAPEAPAGLDGRNIALWPSHGAYYDASDGRWKWQRGRLYGTVEDLFSQSFVVPFLIPMLENAGAYVMTPRERDFNAEEIIIDNDGGGAVGHASFHSGSHHWKKAKNVKGFALKKSVLHYGDNPFRDGTVETVKTVTDERHAARAEWSAPIGKRGEYAVYVSYASLPESAPDALYRVNSAAGTEEFLVDQRQGGGTWIYLGTFPFDEGHSDRPLVELIGVSGEKDRVITADAVRIGGGTGNVDRGGTVSGHRRHNEGARYYLQWAGMPESVYSPTGNSSDYEDDYKCRGLWVNYLSGGSEKNPEQEGLGIPVDLSFAFHTDAGTTSDGSIFGTLAIVSHKPGSRLGDGSERSTVDDYASAVSNQIVNDIRAVYNPEWTQRATRNRAYLEVATPEVPALLIELLSHQNFEDMTYGLNPEFRFTVARAIYKGMLRYLAARDGREAVVQPLPVNSFAISGSGDDYILSWKPTVDSLETTAEPDYYIVEERRGDGFFSELAVVEETWMTVSVDCDDIMSYRVTAVNSGGKSFPSEVLSLCRKGDRSKQVMIVNCFTRLSGPDIVSYGSQRRGMLYDEDFGVAAGRDVAFTGNQTEFRTGIEWHSDDAPGSGASRADHEREIIAGNTFDFVAVHGQALREAGYPFISSSREGFVASMPEVKYLDIILGKQKETRIGHNGSVVRHKTFDQDFQTAIRRFCNDGGNVIASGCYIASDNRGSDASWLRSVLGVDLLTTKATVTGEVDIVKSPFRSFASKKMKFNQSLNADIYAAESPDALSPAGPGRGAVVMRYAENGLSAAVATVRDSCRTFVMGFPLETIVGADSRARVMADAMKFFDAPVEKSSVEKATAAPAKNKAKNKSKKSNKKRKKKR